MKPDVKTLARLIGAHAPYDGSFDLRLPNVHVIKVSRPSTKATHAMQNPSICIVAQGAKSVMIGDDVYSYDAAQVAVYSVDIPVAAQITRATAAEPYPTLKIDLDPRKITELAKRAFPNGLPQARDSRPRYVGEADAHMIDSNFHRVAKAVSWLRENFDQPADVDASAAGRRVGYVSASQFSREYGRFFGNAPTKNIHRLREEGHAANATV